MEDDRDYIIDIDVTSGFKPLKNYNCTMYQISDERSNLVPKNANINIRSNDELLHNYYKKEYIHSQNRKMKNNDVFAFQNNDRKYNFE